MAAPNTNRTDSEEDRASEQVPLQHAWRTRYRTE